MPHLPHAAGAIGEINTLFWPICMIFFDGKSPGREGSRFGLSYGQRVRARTQTKKHVLIRVRYLPRFLYAKKAWCLVLLFFCFSFAAFVVLSTPVLGALSAAPGVIGIAVLVAASI